MSALGFGLLVGSVVTATAVIPRGIKDAAPTSWAIVGGGVLLWIVMPSQISGFVGFLAGAVVPPTIASILLRKSIARMDEKRRLDAEYSEAQMQIFRERRLAAKEKLKSWVEAQEGRSHVSRGRLVHVDGKPKCFVMLASGNEALRIVKYQDDPDFLINTDITLPIKSIISLTISNPTVTKYRTKTVPISVSETKTKSPIARGLIGGVLLGPAGLVLGAASGLGSSTTSSTKHEKISESYDTSGDPELILGTNSPDQPMLKIKFDPPSLADEWMYRIQGAQRV